MKIIDAHAHLLDMPNYLEKLIETMNMFAIEKCCLSGLGDLFGCKDNLAVKQAFENYQNRIIGTYFIRPGKSDPSEVYYAYDQGFKMIKVTIPTKGYNHKSFFSIWKNAQELGMPVLFHTGIVTLPQTSLKTEISSWYMHPMRIETIANAFPQLKIIIAHLGIHWNKEVAELLRMRENIYSDLTGEPDGWRIHLDDEGIKKYLWWDGAFKKLVFGTDVRYDKISTILNQDKLRFDKFNVDEDIRELYYYRNIQNLLEIE
jgi:hypothetical protein